MKIQDNKGFTLIELLIVIAIIGIIAAIAIPGLLRARIAGNEASAIGSMRAVSSAEATFAASCGGGGYVQTLVGLNTGPGGVLGNGFISPDLALDPSIKSGYTVTMSPALPAPVAILAASCNGLASSSTFFVNATPVGVGSTGQRSFATDHRGAVYVQATGAAITNSMAGAVPLQ